MNKQNARIKFTCTKLNEDINNYLHSSNATARCAMHVINISPRKRVVESNAENTHVIRMAGTTSLL